MSIESVRARLHDREVKEGALGTVDVPVCLDVQAAREVERLEDEIAAAVGERPTGKPRLGGQVNPDTPDIADLEAELEAATEAAREATLRLVFRALGSTRYQQVVNNHPDVSNGPVTPEFLLELATLCLWQVWEWEDGHEQLLDGVLPFAEIAPKLTNGELENCTTQVLSLNRRTVDAPFLPSASRKTRR